MFDRKWNQIGSRESVRIWLSGLRIALESGFNIPCGDYEWPTTDVGNGDEGNEHVSSVAQTSDD